MKKIPFRRHQLYLIGIGLILLLILILKGSFLLGAKFTTGEVVYFNSWTGRPGSVMGGKYSAPVIRFTDNGYEITFQGTTNVDLAVGDHVSVVFHEDAPMEARVFSFTGFWLSPLLYGIFPFFLLSAACFSFLGANDLLVITWGKGMKISIRKERQR